jgi:hypothetical protein
MKPIEPTASIGNTDEHQHGERIAQPAEREAGDAGALAAQDREARAARQGAPLEEDADQSNHHQQQRLRGSQPRPRRERTGVLPD